MNEAVNIRRNYYTGCLLGGAIGDALGAPIEFLTIREIRQLYGKEGIAGYVEHADETGEFTDDTQMTLFTAEGLLRSWHRCAMKGVGGALNLLTWHSYLRWLHTQGCLGELDPDLQWQFKLDSGWLIKQPELFKRRAPGSACLASLSSCKTGTLKTPINNSKGCGAVMRMAPVGLVFNNPEVAFQVGCDLAALTHGHPSGYLSAGTFAAIIQQLADKTDLETAIKNALTLLQKKTGHEETLDTVNYAVEHYHLTKASVQSGSTYLPDHIARLGGGWVAEEALALSLFCCLHFRDDFRKGVLASVNHSGDSDSTGSITGNILGLINGESAIPAEWIRNLRYGHIVKEVGEDLDTGCKSEVDEPDPVWWEKYPGY